MIIGTCGFGSSGSSVITDYLKEFDEFCILDDIEFTLPYCPDGLQQLDYVLNTAPVRNESSYVAIERFERLIKNYFAKSGMVKCTKMGKTKLLDICDRFLTQIVQCHWKGYNGTEAITCSRIYRMWGVSVMMQRFIPKYEKILHRTWNGYPYHDIRMSVCPDYFTEFAQEFVSSVLAEIGADFSKTLVLDQPFPGDDPVSCMKYFKNPIAIVVDRDPRDTFIFLKTHLRSRGRFMPSDTVENFVTFYRGIRDKRPYKEENNYVLKIKFENMVYEYDKTTKIVRDFLGLGANPAPKSIFVPEMSMANTQLIHRFPEYTNDVAYITNELPEYLFDFSRYPSPPRNAKMFFGKSPLNKTSGTE